MDSEYYLGITRFCAYWSNAPMLQQTFEVLKKEAEDENDAVIDASKCIVECACRTIIETIKNDHEVFSKSQPTTPEWQSAAIKVLNIDGGNNQMFQKLISSYHKLNNALNSMRNHHGPVSHGRDGFIACLTSNHRRNAVLSADAIISFLHEAYLDKTPDPAETKEPYSRLKKINDTIDCNVAYSFELYEEDEPYYLIFGENRIKVKLSALLYYLDRQAYKEAFLEAQANKMQYDDG